MNTFFGSKPLTTSDALTQELRPEIFSELALDGFFASNPLGDTNERESECKEFDNRIRIDIHQSFYGFVVIIN